PELAVRRMADHRHLALLAQVRFGLDLAVVDVPAGPDDQVPDPLGGGVDVDPPVDAVQLGEFRVGVRGVIHGVPPSSSPALQLNGCTRGRDMQPESCTYSRMRVRPAGPPRRAPDEGWRARERPWRRGPPPEPWRPAPERSRRRRGPCRRPARRGGRTPPRRPPRNAPRHRAPARCAPRRTGRPAGPPPR